MGKGKLAKFADMAEYPHVFEYPYSVADEVPFEMKGDWNRDFFKNDHPIVLELGCGRGEYTVGLARRYPEKTTDLSVHKRMQAKYEYCEAYIDRGLQPVLLQRLLPKLHLKPFG
jgi:tRNA G46 methylase TrmB